MADAAPEDVPRLPGLAQRARSGLIAIAEIEDARTALVDLQTLKNACERAEEATARLRMIRAVAAELSECGVVVQFKAAAAVPGARKQLRTVASNADLQSAALTSRLRSSATQDALKEAKTSADQFEEQLRRVVAQEGARLRPEELDSLALAVPRSEPVSAQLSMLQRDFSTPRSKPPQELPAMVRRWKGHAEQWGEVRSAAQDALGRLHPEVQDFMKAAANPHGAPWSKITQAVRDWLDLNDNSAAYRTRYTDGL